MENGKIKSSVKSAETKPGEHGVKTVFAGAL
jgi:hypothetical protein